MQKLFSVFASIAVIISLSLASGLAVSVQPAAAQKDAACQAIGGCAPANTRPINNAIATVINILSFIGGVIAVIMIIIGGLKFITSGGDSNAISSAKKTVLYAVIGLVIIALAQSIVRFVIARST